MQYQVSGRQSGGSTGDWSSAPAQHRDWKKLVLIVGLGILSWVATYVGMLELIEANMGELPLVHKLIIAFSVGMLMIMIVWLLDQLFAPLPLFTKVLYFARLRVPDHHLGRLRLRLLLEGAGEPLGGLALGGRRGRPGAGLAARRLDPARAADRRRSIS